MKTDFAFAKTRRFAPLFGTQFLGAFNDNSFKTTLFVLISFYGLGANPVLPAAQMLNLGALLFVLPYFLFSALAGQLATRYNKARLAQATKVLEVAVMALAGWGFYIQSATLLLFCLFVLGTQSALFGPVKYAILPEYLGEQELIMGNGLIESGTFIAILLGQIVGTSVAGQSPAALAGLAVLVAVLGLAASAWMPSVAAKEADAKIDWNIWRGTKTLWNETRAHSELFTALMGISWFWFVGAVYTTQLPNFVKTSLHGSTGVFNLMLTLFSVGIAAGSVLCARLSRGQLRLGLVSLGAAGLAVFGSLLAYVVRGAAFAGSAENLQGAASFLAQGAAYPVIGAMLAIGFFGGFFSVPLYTWLQTASSDEFRAKAIAANNIANALFMVAAALISALLLWAFDSILLLYLLVAAGNIVFLAYLGWRAPQVFGLKKK
nr:MFS transporter [uncultured Kingella sp.]